MSNSTEPQEPSFLPIIAMLIGGAISTAICASQFNWASIDSNATFYIIRTIVSGAPIGLVLGLIIFSAIQNKWKISRNPPALALVCGGLGCAILSNLCIVFQSLFTNSNYVMQDSDILPFLAQPAIFAVIGFLIGIFFAPLTHELALAKPKAEETQSNRKNLYLAFGLFLLAVFALVFFVSIRFS